MWRFEEIKNYAAAIFAEFSKKIFFFFSQENFSKKLAYEGEARELVAGKKAVTSREGLVLFFKLENKVWLKVEEISRKGENREGIGNACIGVLD